MKVIIEIPDKDIPKQQDTMSVNFIFTAGCPCQCDYPFDVIKESDDCVSRQYLVEKAVSWDKHFTDSERYVSLTDIQNAPPVTPQYTEAEIQKMQDLESAEIQKAYEIGKDDGSEVLDKIRAELHATAEIHEDGDYYLREEWIDEIFDKYKAERSE